MAGIDPRDLARLDQARAEAATRLDELVQKAINGRRDGLDPAQMFAVDVMLAQQHSETVPYLIAEAIQRLAAQGRSELIAVPSLVEVALPADTDRVTIPHPLLGGQHVRVTFMAGAAWVWHSVPSVLTIGARRRQVTS